MNKKLLALAIGATIALPVIAAADGPTLYGKINLSVDSTDSGTSTAVAVVDNASRLGVKGTADTSVEGVKGLYQVEFGLNADDGDRANVYDTTGSDKQSNIPISQRNTFVGVQGGFGTVLAGIMDTPLKSAQGSVDQFNDTAADMGFAMGGELRAPNIVAYASPKLGDAVTITVAAWQSERSATASGPGSQFADATSASIVYQKDAIYAAVGVDTDVPSGLKVDPAAGSFANTVRGVLGYTADNFELGLIYQTAEAAVSGATGKDTSMLVSGAYKTGAWKFKAQYVTDDGDVTGNTVTQTTAGVDYAVGKSTKVGAFYDLQQNDAWPDDRTIYSVYMEQKF